MRTSTAKIAASAVITEAENTEARTIAISKRGLPRFIQVLLPGTALHQTLVTLADQAVVSITNFLTGIIIARACSKEGLGLYMLGFSIILFATDMQTSVIATPYMVYAPRLKGRAHALYTGSTLIHQLVFCLITTIGVICAAFIVSRGSGPKGLGPVLWALGLVIGLIVLREHARRITFARLRFKTTFILDACIGAGQIGGLLLLAHFGLLSVGRAYWAIGLLCGIAVLVWLWSDRNFYHLSISDSLADLKRNWVLGKWVLASGLVWTIAMNLYPWILAAFHGVASTGVWAACLGVVSIANPALKGIQNLVGPKIAHVHATKGPKALHRLVLKITTLIAIPISLYCLAMFIWGNRLLTLLYGRQYAGNGLVVAILALNLLIGALAFSFSPALFAVDRAHVDFLINFTALFIMATLGLWMVHTYGVLGAAIGLLGGNFAASTVRAAIFLRSPNRISLAEEQIQ